MVDQSGRDLLSQLPLDIIHNILAFVPIRDAVKTSILSRQWKYIWATLPRLIFHDTFVSLSKEDATKVKHFITQTLVLHNGPIHTFKIHVSCINSCQYTDQWLLLLSRKDIKALILKDEDDVYADLAWFRVHSSLYSCRNLNHLEIFYCKIPPPPPNFKGFLCLRRAVLDDVDAPSGILESLVASSPLLEELTLIDYDDDNYQLKIHAPNLKYLYLDGYYKEICLYAPLLAKMSVALDNGYSTIQQKSNFCNYTNFLGGCTNLEELSGDDSFIELCCRCPAGSCPFSLVFNRLTVIKLRCVNFEDIKAILVVVRLIMGAPNLQRLKISSSYFASKVDPIMILWKEFAPDFRFERLRLIEMLEISGLRNEMKLIKFLLERSPVLETLIFKADEHVDDQKLLKLMAKLLRYRRASANAQIILFKQKLKV